MRGKRTVPSLFFSICLCLLPLCISVILSLGQCLFLCCYIAMYLYVSFSFFCLFLCFCLQSIRLSLSLSLFFFFLLALSTSFSCYQTIYVFLLFLPFSCSLSFSSSLTISWYRHSFLSCYLSLAVSLSLTFFSCSGFWCKATQRAASKIWWSPIVTLYAKIVCPLVDVIVSDPKLPVLVI